MEESTKDIKRIPVHFEFGSHDEKSKDSLNSWKQKIESTLKSQEKGKVIIFLENANTNMYQSATVSVLVTNGLLPSDAFALTDFIAHHSRTANQDELHKWKAEHPLGKFFEEQLTILDDITIKYPGRIYVLPEWAPDKILSTYDFKQEKKSRRKIVELALDGKFEDAIPFLKDSLGKMVERVKQREPRIIETIKEDLEGEENILAFVGHIGAAHTGIFHELKKDGFSVNRNFSEKQGETYYYDPYAAALRQLLFFPEKKLTDEDWHKLLILITTNHLLEQLGDNPEMDQKYKKMLWEILGKFTSEEIKLFEEKAKRVGFVETLESLGDLS